MRRLALTLLLLWPHFGMAEPAAHSGIGRSPTAQEIAAWDIDVGPDGRGLPTGSGSVVEGRAIYGGKCAHCHGVNGEGGPFDRLAGGATPGSFPFPDDPKAQRSIGNYWPYATTLFDYTRRAMPFDAPGSLRDDEIYALCAFVMFLNGLVTEDTVLDAHSLPLVEMPARARFVVDDRRGGAEVK